MAQNFIFEAKQLDGFIYAPDYGAFLYSIYPMPFVLADGGEYTVIWGDDEFTRTASSFVAPDGAQCVFVGNQVVIGGELTDEPFAIVCDNTNSIVHFFSTDDQTGHWVGVYQTVPDEPEEETGIVIKNYSGNPVTYTGVEKVMFNTSDGGTQIFSKGEAVENVPIAVDFSDGDQVITAPDGTLVKSAIIQKPETLIPENIAEGVEIAGVVGTHSGGGGDVFSDENFKFFAYNINTDTNIITLYKILYDVIYAETGSYDVTVPDKIGGYDVVIACE